MINFKNIRYYCKNKEISTSVFLILAITIILPLLTGKYFFLLDLIPRINDDFIYKLFYGYISPVYGGSLPLHLFSFFISSELFQKIYLLVILFLSGLSVYYIIPLNSKFARFFAGFLYTINPYTYIRILSGQWFILFSYSILPLALKAFIDLLEKKGRKEIIKFVFILTFVGFNTHMLVVTLTTISIIFIFWFRQNRNVEAIKIVTFVGILFILLGAYWIIPFSTSKNTLLNNIGEGDLIAFAPRIESFSSFFTLASMHGFWRDGYVYAKDFLPFWQALFVFILFLSVYGFISYYRDEKIRIYVKSFAVVGIVGLILAAGIQSPVSEIFRWLFDHMPLIKGMRDSHRFIALLVLAYAYLGALGVGNISEGIKSKEGKKRYISIALVALALSTPFIYSFTFFGFAGQIKATDYPTDWYEVNEFLNNDSQDFKVLFLPWHMYMDFHWVPNRDKRIVNPAEHFFDKEIISGKNIEIDKIYRQVYSPEQLYVDFLLKERENITNLGELVMLLNVKYILLTKEVDYKKYFLLFNQSDLELVKETENFYVFRNKHAVAKLYEVDSVTYIKDWRELLERSKREDITQRVYLIGEPLEDTQENSEKEVLNYRKKSAVRYELREKPSKKYLVFTEPYSESWVFDGKKPIVAYGMISAYKVDDMNSREIKYERFYTVCVPSYLMSILTFIILFVFYLDLHKIYRNKAKKLKTKAFLI